MQSFDQPFGPASLWNTPLPAGAVLGSDVVPPSIDPVSGLDYAPLIEAGNLTAAVYQAVMGDEQMVIWGPKKGVPIHNLTKQSLVPCVTVPKWPQAITIPSGGDGHVCIVVDNMIYSFEALRIDAGGRLRAFAIGYGPLDGTGFGTKASPYVGSRASGVSPMAGLIRTKECQDLTGVFPHALAMSLAWGTMKPGPVGQTFAQDGYAADRFKGPFPTGCRMTLVPEFDPATLKSPFAQKVARTLQKFGAFVVDSNSNTPFVIYAEYGSGVGMDWQQRADLDQIRAGLRAG